MGKERKPRAGEALEEKPALPYPPPGRDPLPSFLCVLFEPGTGIFLESEEAAVTHPDTIGSRTWQVRGKSPVFCRRGPAPGTGAAGVVAGEAVALACRGACKAGLLWHAPLCRPVLGWGGGSPLSSLPFAIYYLLQISAHLVFLRCILSCKNGTGKASVSSYFLSSNFPSLFNISFCFLLGPKGDGGGEAPGVFFKKERERKGGLHFLEGTS